MLATLPDPLTVSGMTATVACALAWVMGVLGHPYWRKGLTLAIASTLLYGLAYGLMGVYSLMAWTGLQVTAHMLLSTAIAVFTLALQRFQYDLYPRRDAAIVLVPVAASLLLGAAWVIYKDMLYGALQTSVYVLQLSYTVGLIWRIRHCSSGMGWWWLAGAVVVQLAGSLWQGIALWQGSAAGTALPALKEPLPAWLLCQLMLVQLVVASIGYLLLLRECQAVLEHDKAQRDPLTQLPNRAALVQSLRQSMAHAAQQSQSMAIMLLDIDHFKSVNDTYGHLVGDDVIQNIAYTLVRQLRSTDVVARYGGEEFVVVLPHATAREAFHIAESLCQAVRQSPLALPSGKLLHITISIGVYAGAPVHGSSWERLVGIADEAMYRAKNNGRDRVFMSTPVQTMRSHAAPIEG